MYVLQKIAGTCNNVRSHARLIYTVVESARNFRSTIIYSSTARVKQRKDVCHRTCAPWLNKSHCSHTCLDNQRSSRSIRCMQSRSLYSLHTDWRLQCSFAAKGISSNMLGRASRVVSLLSPRAMFGVRVTRRGVRVGGGRSQEGRREVSLFGKPQGREDHLTCPDK